MRSVVLTSIAKHGIVRLMIVSYELLSFIDHMNDDAILVVDSFSCECCRPPLPVID